LLGTSRTQLLGQALELAGGSVLRRGGDEAQHDDQDEEKEEEPHVSRVDLPTARLGAIPAVDRRTLHVVVDHDQRPESDDIDPWRRRMT
jgi:hypothetical protein